MRFYLGTHQVNWLGVLEVPLFVSVRRIKAIKALPRALAPWALDSGGFSELSLYGQWQTSPKEYAQEVRRASSVIGRLEWAAIQDYMCEPVILAKTGLTLEEHQKRTVESYRTLRELAPEIQWAPVLQGFSLEDYQRCLELYQSIPDIDLYKEPIVGLGTMCRRQGTAEAERIVKHFSFEGLKIHAFGFKMRGLQKTHFDLASSDSLAWSLHARKRPPLDGCPHGSCASCPVYALQWRARLLNSLS